VLRQVGVPWIKVNRSKGQRINIPKSPLDGPGMVPSTAANKMKSAHQFWRHCEKMRSSVVVWIVIVWICLLRNDGKTRIMLLHCTVITRSFTTDLPTCGPITKLKWPPTLLKIWRNTVKPCGSLQKENFMSAFLQRWRCIVCIWALKHFIECCKTHRNWIQWYKCPQLLAHFWKVAQSRNSWASLH